MRHAIQKPKAAEELPHNEELTGDCEERGCNGKAEEGDYCFKHA